eukprot:gene21225-25498_t
MNAEHVDLLDQAIQLFWNFNLAECESILAPHIDRLPLFSLLYTDIAFIKSVLTETKEDIDEAKTLVMKGIIEFKAQNNIKAGMSFRKSWKQYYQAFEMAKSLPTTFPLYKHIVSAAFYGVGFFHFLVSVVPPQYMWLVEGIGFKANRMEGLKEIKFAADLDSGVRSVMAKVCYILLHVFFFEDNTTPESTIQELLNRYPNGAMIHYMSGAVLRKQGKIQLSSQAYESAYSSSSQLKQLQLFINSELGYNEFLNLEWAKAEAHLSKFMRETTSSGFKAFIAYQLACCYELQNNHDQALSTMASIDAWVRKGYDFDEFSSRKANRYLKTRMMTPFEKIYLQSSLLNEAHRFDESISLLLEAIAMPSLAHEELGAAEYLLGQNYQQLDRRVEARKFYTAALTHEKHMSYDHFVIPYSNLGLGEISLLEDKKAECKTHIKKAKSYNSTTYDFPSIMDWRARKCLQQLGEF